MRTAAFLPPASSRETFPVQPWASTLAPIQPRASAPAPVQPRSAQTPLTKPTRASVWARKEAAHEPLAPSPAPASGIRHVRVAAVCIQLWVRAALLKRAHGKMLCQAEQHRLSKAVCVGEKVNDTDKKKVNKPLGPTDSPKHRGASRLRSGDTRVCGAGAAQEPGSVSARPSPRVRQVEELGAPRSPRCWMDPTGADLSVPWSPAGLRARRLAAAWGQGGWRVRPSAAPHPVAPEHWRSPGPAGLQHPAKPTRKFPGRFSTVVSFPTPAPCEPNPALHPWPDPPRPACPALRGCSVPSRPPVLGISPSCQDSAGATRGVGNCFPPAPAAVSHRATTAASQPSGTWRLCRGLRARQPLAPLNPVRAAAITILPLSPRSECLYFHCQLSRQETVS